MAVAAVIQMPHPTQLQPGLGIALGIELYHLNPVRGYECHKGNVMLLRHGVVDGEEMRILHALYGHAVGLFCFFRFQWGAV